MWSTGVWGAGWDVGYYDALQAKLAADRITADAEGRWGVNTGKSDAVKHSAGAASIAASLGARAAEILGYAHEKDAYDNASSHAFNSTMDLFNNDAGIAAGSPYHGSSTPSPSETDWVTVFGSIYDAGHLLVWWPAGAALIKPTGTNEGVLRLSNGKHIDD